MRDVRDVGPTCGEDDFTPSAWSLGGGFELHACRSDRGRGSVQTEFVMKG